MIDILFLYKQKENFMSKNNYMLKMLAQQAKNRLRGKDSISKKQINFRVYCNNSENIKNVIISSKEDELMYKKVVGLLQKDEEINVVSYLIDKKYFNSLSEQAKQRYFLTTLDKYRKFKQRYQEEQQKQSNIN